MKISVLLFASYRDKVGQKALTLELKEGASVAEAAKALEADHPKLSLKGALAAIDENYAKADATLKDGDTLAFFPPVSGGAAHADAEGQREDGFIVTESPLELSCYVSSVSQPAWGAVATFLGTVRSPNAGSDVLYIDYHGYESMMLTQMRLAVQEARQQYHLGRIVVAHRLGRLEPGEASIAIVVSSAHRREALAACSALIDRLKELLPVWKYEVRKDDAAWVAGLSAASEPL